MTDRNGVIKGLRDQECERGTVTRRPPIPYVPVNDEVQDALNINHKERLQKFKLPNGTEFNAGIWYTGTPEEFLNHVKQAVHACERLGYFKNYQAAKKAHGESKKAHADAVSEHETAVEERSTDSNEDADEDANRDADVHIAILEGEVQRQEENMRQAEETRVDAAEAFFSTYANLLSIEARITWERIVEQQIGTTPWTDLKGKKHTKVQLKTKKSFDDCVTHHLLTYFGSDAADRQKYYINNYLKKPQRVTVRAFFTRVEQLNSYIKLLPGLYNSPMASPATKPVEPFDEADLACQLLRMCPESWQDQYNLAQETVPQDTRKLLLVLENIEKIGVNQKPAANNAGTNAKSVENNGKRKGMNSSTDRIPKKKRTEKHCVLCKKYGGAPSSHNTSECTKYDKDGKLKAGWNSKSASTGKYSDKRKSDGQSFAQVFDKFSSKMEKVLKKAAKSSSRKKRKYDSDSGSDSE